MTLVKNFFFVLDQAFCRTSVSCLIGFSLWKCVFEYWKTIYVDIPSLVELSNNPGPLARSLSLSVQQRDPLASSAISPPFPVEFLLHLLGKSEHNRSYVFVWLLALFYQRERKRYKVSNDEYKICSELRRQETWREWCILLWNWCRPPAQSNHPLLFPPPLNSSLKDYNLSIDLMHWDGSQPVSKSLSDQISTSRKCKEKVNIIFRDKMKSF